MKKSSFISSLSKKNIKKYAIILLIVLLNIINKRITYTDFKI